MIDLLSLPVAWCEHMIAIWKQETGKIKKREIFIKERYEPFIGIYSFLWLLQPSLQLYVFAFSSPESYLLVDKNIWLDNDLQVRLLEVALVKRWSENGVKMISHSLIPDSMVCVKDIPLWYSSMILKTDHSLFVYPFSKMILFLWVITSKSLTKFGTKFQLSWLMMMFYIFFQCWWWFECAILKSSSILYKLVKIVNSLEVYACLAVNPILIL